VASRQREVSQVRESRGVASKRVSFGRRENLECPGFSLIAPSRREAQELCQEASPEHTPPLYEKDQYGEHYHVVVGGTVLHGGHIFWEGGFTDRVKTGARRGN
jgi:hypothetical protein